MSSRTKQFSGDHQLLVWAVELEKPPATGQQQSESSNCPRCGSTSTKFCYYNNYNKSQPRHFCKSCKRHWTKGGTLRNVPVGGVRKNKRPKIPIFVAANNSPPQQNCPNLIDTGCDQKHISNNILHQDLIGPSYNSFPLLHETIDGIRINIFEGGINPSTDLNALAPLQNSRTESPFSSVSNTFNTSTPLIPTPYPFLNSYDDHYVGNLDSTEESTVTSVNIPTACYNPWYDQDTSTATDLSNYWNWNEIDVLDSNDHLNITWDYGNYYNDTEIKP